MDDEDITKKFPILLEGILQDVYSQRAASAWQGAQPQKLTVSMLLPGTSSAAEWRDLLQSRRQFWPTLTTRHASLVPVSVEALQRERRQMQAKHLWYNVNIRWSDLKDKLEVLAPTGLFFFPPFPKAMRGIPPGRCKLHGPGSTWKASQRLQKKLKQVNKKTRLKKQPEIPVRHAGQSSEIKYPEPKYAKVL